MAKYRLAVALLAAALGLLTTGTLSQVTSIITNPPAGSTVNTFPDSAEFQCSVEVNDTQVQIQWYIDGNELRSSLIIEGYSISASTTGTFDSFLTVPAPRDSPEVFPFFFNITCAPPGSPEAFYANFTLIVQLVDLRFGPVEGDVIAPEGFNVSVCVDAIMVAEGVSSPFPISVDLRVLPQSTASGDDYDIPPFVSFDGFMEVCVNVYIVDDGDNTEDVETIEIQLENSSSSNARIVPGSSIRMISILCTENAVRLTGGVDSEQGRVEICYQGAWGSVCTAGWDQPDAQVVCRQLGLMGQPSAYVNAFGNVFPNGGGIPVFNGAQCVGTELDLLNCTSVSGGLSANVVCPLFGIGDTNAAVDCAGRTEPFFNFEMPQTNLVEGDTQEVCVVLGSGVLESGVITVPLIIGLEIPPIESPTPSATFRVDFITIPPLDNETQSLNLTFNPGQTSQCINVILLDDEDIENTEEIIFGLVVSSLRSPRRQRILIIDNDMDCGNGSLCVDRAQASTRCIDVTRVCDGFTDCVDNSDETNCPVCPGGQYTCLSEDTCLNSSIMCDGYPDCVGRLPGFTQVLGVDEFQGCPPDGCVPGSVDLVGGVREREGAVRVCMNGNRVPVSATGLSILEASLLCRESGLGKGGYPYPTSRLPTTTVVTVSCTDGDTSLSECVILESAPLNLMGQQASLTCRAETCTDGRVRVVSGDGLESREGRVEVCYRGVWGAILDDRWTNRDAAVVCREMGYPAQGAMPIFGAVYDDEPLPFVSNGFTCAGNESSIMDCPGSTPFLDPPQLGTNSIFSIVGVRCDDYKSNGCTDMDVRLTYRGASGYSGQFEICNNGIWQRTCSNSNFEQNAATAACSQLFGLVVTSLTLATITSFPEVLSETGPAYDRALFCGLSDASIRNCGSEPSDICNPDNQPTVTCPSPPVVYVSPISVDHVYRVETGYMPSVSCAVDLNTNPLASFSPGGGLPGLRKKRVIAQAQLPLESRRVFNEPVFDGGIRTSTCSAFNGVNTTTVNITVEVLVGEGPPEFAFLQMSSFSSQRFAQLPNLATIAPPINLEQLPESLQMLISERTPGVQIVSSCALIESPIDVERGLDRIECEIVHYNRPDQTEVTTAAQVATRLGTLLTLVNTPALFNIVVIEPAQVAFTSLESIAVEGDGVVTICLAVISGEITTPTNINLTTFPGLLIDSPPDTEINIALASEGTDYNIAGGLAEDVNGFPVVLTLTLQIGATQACFNVDIVDDAVFDGESDRAVEQVTFSYSSSSPTVARVNLRHTLVILDNDRNCSADFGLGSRLCANTVRLSVDCILPAQVCDFNTADCPDVSDELNCPSPIEDIVNQTISVETYTNVSEVVSSFAALSENRTFLQTMQFLNDVSTVLNNIANLTNTTNTRINETVVTNLGQTLNSLIQWQPSNLEVDTTSRIVESFEEVATQFAQQSNLTMEFTDFTIVIELGATETFMREGRTEDFTRIAGVSASIVLPPSLFNQVPADRRIIGVYFALYENSALLPTNLSAVVRDNVTVQETFVGTPIVAATVGPGIDFGDDVPLNPPVVITLGLLPLSENASANLGTARCVSWDFVTDSWITDGCTTEVVNETTFRCSCTHLTNFAVLVDICQRAQDCVNNEIVDQVLSFISYIGVALSCVGLVVTIITLILFKKLRERDNSKYHIQLSIAILCMLIVFAVGIERIEVYGGCVFVSILIHYFSLVAVMWMGAEALLMFQKLVIVFMSITTKFIVILSLVCWLFPLIPVLIPMIIDLADGTTPETDLIITRNVDPSTGDVIGGFCFLKHPGVFFGAFLAPIFAIILFNMVIFIWVIVILLKHTRGKMERSSEKMGSKTALRLLVSISGIMFLFGLTWLFAAFTFTIDGSNVVRTVFQILFVVFASFQGFYIFLFFVVFNSEARESWREFLSCGRYKSELLHPSQYKNTSSAGSGTRTHKTKTTIASSAVGNTYNTANLDSEAGPLPEKIDLNEKPTDIPLTSTADQAQLAEEGVSTFSRPNIVVESQVDGDDDEKTPPNWSDASPVANARVKRYSTKKVSKHHIEEYEIDFEKGDSDQEVPET